MQQQQQQQHVNDLWMAYIEQSKEKKPTKDDSSPRKPNYNDANAALPEPPPAQSKRPLSSHIPAPSSLFGIGILNIASPQSTYDVDMEDPSEGQAAAEQPRKRAAIGDGISAGSASPFRDLSASPPPRRSKARPTSGQYGGSEKEMFDSRPKPGNKQLWTEDTAPLSKSSFVDLTNIASIQAQRSRAQPLQPPQRRSFPATTTQISRDPQSPQAGPQILSRNSLIQSLPPREESYDIIIQPETRPISQEQLVAEVKGIYAGLVMVEAKCIEVDNKQATPTQADPTSQPKLNNEQWQALIALHRTLLHEHHDFFLASQHPSASAALRRLASKYAMPARMWRHGIHSFLELLRHRLPASLDHMLAFIYLAYSMMALLYETVPAFEDTWIECLGDLGRYRIAIEDDDIRDREVWTGVARHWYSNASDKSPTTGRLYHHLAILARPNALQQLFYYAKSLCVAVPFTSARESILTLFQPELSENSGQKRVPPLDPAFVRAHGLLFTNRNIEKFDFTVKEFLDNQIRRVTRRFMEQGYHIAVANSVAMPGLAYKDNPAGELDVEMSGDDSLTMTSFQRAQHLSNKTLEIVLHRIGDPNVLPFIHVTLVFMYHLARHPRAMKLPYTHPTLAFMRHPRDHPRAMRLRGTKFPWGPISIALNILLASYHIFDRIESDTIPLPEKDERPLPEDYTTHGLLWSENYFPETWFTDESILTLLEPGLSEDSAQGRVPPLGSAFVEAHRHLFPSRGMEIWEPAVDEFMSLLDKQIGRGTRKFMEQGYHIAVANAVTIFCFASKDNNILMKAISDDRSSASNILINGSSMDSASLSFFWECLNNPTLEIVLERIRDPNILPEKDEHPLPKDHAMRGLLRAENYFPETWFTDEKIDEKEKYHEVASMPANRKIRILWPTHRIVSVAVWTASAILTAFHNKAFRSMAFLTHVFKHFPVTLASGINKTNSTATGTNLQPEHDGNGPSHYFRHVWHQLRNEHSGPIIENTAVAILLSSSYAIITRLNDGPKPRTPILPLSRASGSRSWLEADLLPIATTFISVCTLYLRNGKLESDLQLAMLLIHNFCLSLKFNWQNLSRFPKTKKPAEFIMASTSLLSSGLLTKFIPVDEGRYKNSLVQAAMFLPLTNLFLTVFWIRFIRNYGVAKALEEGDLVAAIRAFWERRSHSIIAVILILWLLAKV
ncbi:hypothetical protein ACEPPN_003095 [Leptodophora sp. 'Broadleaf-Isolate-01']